MKITVIIHMRKSISCKEPATKPRDRRKQEGTGFGGGALSKLLKWALIIRACYWLGSLHDNFMEISAQLANLLI